MSAITFSGLSTGIDTAKMVEQLIMLEKAPIRQMEQRRTDYQSQRSIVQTINSKLQALQTKAQELDTLGEFLSYTGTSSEDDEITVSATGDAGPGTYEVAVTARAKAQRNYSDAFSDETEEGAAGAGDLTITIDGEDSVIEVEATDTIETIVGKINASDIDVTASLLSTTDGYRIQVNGNNSGTDNAITFAEDGTLALNLDEAGSLYQAATNAALTIDGFGITSQDNEVDDAIDGVTLNLLSDTTSSDVEVKVAPSTDEIKKTVNEFVNTYNEVLSLIHKEFAFTGEAKNAGRLPGDSTLRSVQNGLASVISNAVDDLDGSYSALSQIGIKTGTDGRLSVDGDDLADAINSDPSAVGQLFAGTADHSVDGVADQLDSLIDSYIDSVDGMVTAKIDGLEMRIDGVSDSMERFERRVAKREEQLRLQFTNMEVFVSQLNSQSNFLANQTFAW